MDKALYLPSQSSYKQTKMYLNRHPTLGKPLIPGADATKIFKAVKLSISY
jgi:hypothetical protein